MSYLCAVIQLFFFFFFFSSRRRHTRFDCDWSSDVCSSDVNKGVGCATCHGQINQMPLVFQANTLLMQWCLDCHRNPEQVLRPKDQVFNMDWKAPDNQAEVGARLREEYKIRTTVELTSCSTCHR